MAQPPLAEPFTCFRKRPFDVLRASNDTEAWRHCFGVAILPEALKALPRECITLDMASHGQARHGPGGGGRTSSLGSSGMRRTSAAQTERRSFNGGQFAATRWSVVLAANEWRAGTAARRAMGDLVQTYWFPLYAYLRRRGHAPAQAEDLVQGFFAQLLEKDALARVDRERGKFRSFLLASLQNFLANEWDKSHAAKRGGGAEIVALDALEAEARYAAEPVDSMTAERVFERRWALAVLEQVLARLREDYAGRKQAEIFAALEHVLTAGDGESYGAIGARLGMTEAAVKVAAHRLRRRYRELLREEIAQTVSQDSLVEDEIRQLLACL